MMNQFDYCWQQKLMAFLHDTPDKCLDIATHEESAARVQQGAGFVDMKYRIDLEQKVKSADIFDACTERILFGKGQCRHDFATDPVFIHPLSSVHFPFSTQFTLTAKHQEHIHVACQGIQTDNWKEKFFLYWRRWCDNAVARNPELAFLPADTRIPDHTIWNHMSMTAAFAACIEDGKVKPELLLFNLGPIQNFIAQARTTKDLWSGSYLLSWLMAHGLKMIADEIGPDAVVFPSLRGNGIFDSLYKETYYATTWKGINGNNESTWQRIQADKGEHLNDWLLTPTLPNRFLAVVPSGRGVELAKKVEAAIRAELAKIGDSVWSWMLSKNAQTEWKSRWDAQLNAFPQITWATQAWEKDSWTENYKVLTQRLAARRNTRDFTAWPSEKGAPVKDSLSGQEECIGDEKFYHQNLFKPATHRYGAMNIIKRKWDETYLNAHFGLRVSINFSISPEALCNNSDPYYAILAMDGDEMGKLISGESTPELRHQLPDAVAEKIKHRDESTLQQKRKLTPSYHLQFSEALANFALYQAREIVESIYKGKLIYAGGDDVLAMVPAKSAIACAQALRKAFRTDFDQKTGRIYPGSACDVSTGIAFGHLKAPIQMLVKEAQRAEQMAKNRYGRKAVALTLYKRSGEIIEWGCKWDSGALELMQKVTDLTNTNKLSGRFPYALAQLLQVYGEPKTDLSEIIFTEFQHVVERQGETLKQEEKSELLNRAKAYLMTLKDFKSQISDFTNLYLAETFINRARGEQ